MIVLGSNETFANQDISSQKTLTFDATPSQPSRQRIWFEVLLTFNVNPDTERTITFLTQITGGTTDYGREFRAVVNGDDSNPNQVIIGPSIVPYSTIILLKIESDNAADTDVSVDVRMLVDDEHYRFTGRTTETSPLADSLEHNIKAIQLLTKASGDGDLAAIKTAAERLTAVRAAVLTDWINDGRLDVLLDAIPTTAMRGTDNAALASVCTEARLAELAAANMPADIDTINTNAARLTAVRAEVLTDWINDGRLDLLLDAIKVVTDALTAAAAAKLALSAGTIVTGAAEAGTLSTTQMTTDLSEATDDHYNGRILIWTSGVLQNQATSITDYAGATGLLTFTATTEAASAADTFVIL